VENIDLVLKGGAWVPSITIRSNGQVDAKATAKHVLALHDSGAEGVVVNGTTGGGHEMSVDEKVAVIREVGKLHLDGMLRKGFVLITGTGTQDAQEAEAIIREAHKNGFHGVLALPGKPAIGFYEKLARACASTGLALMLYNHPRLDKKYSFAPDVLARLMARFPSVIGVKDSSGAPSLLSEWKSAAKKGSGREPLVAVGEDKLVHYNLSLGHNAAIAGTANTREGLRFLLGVFKNHRLGRPKLAAEAQKKLAAVTDRLLAHPLGFRIAAEENRL